ncbi:MAG: hypothetical protein GWN99_10395 [Gemmatimonadetes bacterium]|uniref:Uncharacterized protein n=1 Tax=Candidatus Kutchimonas denitrificans TaxID=3056748 RepID=A0AAE4Z7E0_9BACT|nr:hypothetical protein [Gemmatimonadota bacterium]NIR74704.1 hypothetical protein [Candidatus Kutchimonas denitrificans]NIS01454.1 hypothetical protein [Gemmatimonadota bacterium]NIT67195.1 hypothetical protein [Gemmatimonadota bacterium]NIU52369.1 hypothetical protein [Gemmatimonadota bacterium]
MHQIQRRWKVASHVLLVALLVLIAVPRPATGQEYTGKRKFIYALIGALAVGVPAYIAANESDFSNFCSNRTCMGFLGASLGGAVGFLIGSEVDASYERRMAAGPSLSYTYESVPLDLVPDRLTWFPGGAAVAGVGGARIVFNDGSTLSRASGVRGIEDVAVLPGLDLLVLSTFSNLIAFPVLGDTASGAVIDERGGGAMENVNDRLAVASLDSLRLLRVLAREEGLSVEELAGIEHREFVTDMIYAPFSGVAWLLLEDLLVSYSPDFERLGEFRLPVIGRSVRADGSRLAVAAGSSGVYVLDARDPKQPRVVLHYTGVRFAYTADLAGDRLYVAAGPEGVVLIDVSGAEPVVLGVAREMRFASDVVAADDGAIWILDREGRSVQIADFATEATGEPSARR